MDIVNNLLASMLGPVKTADAALAEALQMAGQGVEWGGQAIGEVGSALENIKEKVEKLQKMLRGEPV
jgi:hypothetical protein